MGRRASGRWLAVVGARPNFVKLAPLRRAAEAIGRPLDWLHTGQHTSAAMSEELIRDLDLPPPAARLKAPPGGPRRVAEMTDRLVAALTRLRPSLVTVFGDVDSTVAGARAAHRLGLPLAHVEAGLRTFESDLPEEQNRLEVDRLSDRLHASEPVAVANLKAEGIPARRIRLPGNVMADALRIARPLLETRVPSGGSPFVMATLHRQGNVDDPARLDRLTEALVRIAHEVPVVWPVHPRTRRRLAGRIRRLRAQGLDLRPPAAYLDFLALVSRAAAVVTDSGGLQVEAALLGVPCLTVRRRTEHQLTLDRGANRLVPDPRRLPGALRGAMAAEGAPKPNVPRVWDGHAARRIVADWQRGIDR